MTSTSKHCVELAASLNIMMVSMLNLKYYIWKPGARFALIIGISNSKRALAGTMATAPQKLMIILSPTGTDL
jgi:hypothetical protein